MPVLYAIAVFPRIHWYLENLGGRGTPPPATHAYLHYTLITIVTQKYSYRLNDVYFYCMLVGGGGGPVKCTPRYIIQNT